MTTHTLSYLLATALVLAGPIASASEVGQFIADQIDVASYQYYLDEVLYTHDGDNRGPNGPEHDPARDNILVTFQSFGLAAELHEFSYEGYEGENVVATQVGALYPDAQFVVGAHYDSVGNPGADDDASGVAGLLEMARVLSQYDTEYTIKYIAFDLEESGLVGSEAYVADHYYDNIRGMVQLDMIVWDFGLYAVDIGGSSASAPLKNALAAAINEYGNGLDGSGWSGGSSDHASFELAGFLACLLIEDRYPLNPCYHRPCDSVDTPDYISYPYAADSVRSVAGFLADYAGVIVPEECVGDLDGDNDTDHADLGVLLGDWGCTSDCVGDLDDDGDTDEADLGVLLADWGCGT